MPTSKAGSVKGNAFIRVSLNQIKPRKGKITMDFKTELSKSVQLMIDRKWNTHQFDRTYESVIKEVTPKGYLVLDETGNTRTVPCCIPNISLKAGQKVWLKEPLGDLKKLHICGIA